MTPRPLISKKQKLRQKKAREVKRLQRIDESPEIREERIEWARDKRSRVSEATNYEILNNLDFEEVHTDSQWSESDQNEEQFSLSILMFSMKSKLQEMVIECLEPYLLEHLEMRNIT